jgi:anti-anti-sigma factor
MCDRKDSVSKQTQVQVVPVTVRWKASASGTDVGSPFDFDVRPPEHAVGLTVVLALRPVFDGGLRAVVAVSGEIDIATVEPLHCAALGIARAAHPRPDQALQLVLDLEGVTFLDSSVLHLLQHLYAEGIDRGWTLRLIVPAALGPYRVLRLAASRGWLPRGLMRRELPPAPRTDCPAAAAIPHPSAA